jgi:cell wall-associated NlpC family hydrolase
LSRKSVIVLAIILGLLGSAAPSYAKTPKPTLAQIDAAKQAEVAKQAAANDASANLANATQTLRTLSSQADNARARYLQAQKVLVTAAALAKIAALHAKKTSAAVNVAHRTIGKLATNAYIMGGGLTDIEPLLSSNGPQDLVDRLSILNTLGARNSTVLDRYTAAQVAATAAQKRAVATKIAQQRATSKVASAKKAADDAKAAQQAEVDKLQALQNQLMNELSNAKKFRITLEQQRQMALLEEANARKAAQTPGQKSIWADRGFKGRANTISTEKQRLAAVYFAKKQVLARKPYIWGAQGPNAYDCSGLVYAAFKYAGLHWPEWNRLNAALYSVATKHIPLSQIQPGDLLFYSFDGSVQSIHHISIYAGNGMMWEANSTRVGLIFSNMYSVKGLMPFGGRV